MSIAIRNIFTGVHPKLASHVGSGLAIDKPNSTNSVSQSASSNAQRTPTSRIPDTLLSTDSAPKNTIAPELSKQSPVVQIAETQLPELFLSNNVMPEKLVLAKQDSKKPVKIAAPDTNPAKQDAEDEQIRTAGYFITVPGGQNDAMEKSGGFLPAPQRQLNTYNPKQNLVGKMVNLTIS